MKTHAHTTGIRCAQVGIFIAPLTLLPSECNLENVINHIGGSKKIVRTKKPFKSRRNFVGFDDVHPMGRKATHFDDATDDKLQVLFNKFKD